jgi:hypothetical protein
MTHKLSETQFNATFGRNMLDVTELADATVNIWPYVEELKNNEIVLPHVYENQLVEKVYRSSEDTFDHILLPTSHNNRFIVIVIDLNASKVYGHHLLDLEVLYGLKEYNT